MKNDSSCSGLQSNLKLRLPQDYPWKILSRLTEDYSYCLTPEQIREISHVIRLRDFDAYLRLGESWGPCGINAHDTLDVVNFRTRYQIASLIKKYRFPTSKKQREEAARKKFLEAEQACFDYNRAGYKSLRNLQDPVELKAFTYALRFLERLLGSYLPEPEKLTLWSRHGPGASLDTTDGKTSLYDKYSEWPYSCTTLAAGYAREAIEADERWIGALENSYRERYNIPKHRILNRQVFWDTVISIKDANRVAFVPKNALTERSIAIEPAMNLYLQLGVDGYIRRRLKRWGVDLDSQVKNQKLAKLGSTYWRMPESYVTLDLAAASDTVSLAVCETLLPDAWFQYLCMLRSPLGTLDGQTFSYEKISSMGNGYTFALESAIFTALTYGSIRALKGSVSRDDFAVYGDDIVLPSPYSSLLIRMLQLSGFAVNKEKSFLSGPFRESCGADYYNGELVRPVFLTEKPSTIFGVWCDRNRLHRALEMNGFLCETLLDTLYDRWIPDIFKRFIGPYSDTDFDSYKHCSTPQGKYRNGVWEFKRLTLSYQPDERGHDFHFRKLMHPLRRSPDILLTAPWSSKTWGGKRIAASGSVFPVTDMNSVTVGVAPTRTDIWSGQYTSLLP